MNDPEPAAAAPAEHRSSMTLAILAGGLVAGTADFIFAVVYYKAAWNRIARVVASGVLDREGAATGGTWVVPLGIVLHFVIATGAAAVFVGASRWLPVLRRQPGVAGLAYGVVVYFVMNWVVVPLSALTVREYPPPVDWVAVLGHMVLVGMPIALAARWFVGLGRDPRPAMPG